MGVSDSVTLVGAVVAILGSAVPILSKIVKAWIFRQASTKLVIRITMTVEDLLGLQQL